MSEPERDGWGRYKLPHPETGELRSWTRVTKLAEVLDDKFGLLQWQKRNVVYGIGVRQDLADLAAASDLDDKQQLDDVIKQATAAAKADARANRGTAFHKFTQRIDQGEPVRAPGRWAGDIAVYKQALAEWGILTHPKMCERITVVPELEVAGTMDKIVKYQELPTIFDLKSGGNVILGGMKIAIQLAIYSRGGGLWDMDKDCWRSMPRGLDQNRGLIMHLPAGGELVDGKVVHSATLYEVDLNVGWEMAKIAYAVREGRKKKDYLVKTGESVTVTTTDEQG
jgi:hypothetical protein